MRIGIIGTGAIAQRHLLALQTIPVATQVACHLATTTEKAIAAVQQWGGDGYTDLDTFIRDGRPDAVFVTVPPRHHGGIEAALIRRRLPFLVEKPLSADRGTAEQIGKELESLGLVTAVGYQWRALDALATVRRHMADRPVQLVAARYLSGTPGKAWWRRQGESGGQVVEQACHVIDLARHLTGGATVLAATSSWAPRPAFPDADIAGSTAALMRFGEGVPGAVEVSCLTPHLQDAHVFLLGEGWSATIAMARTVIEADGQRIELAQDSNAYATQAMAFLSAVTRGRPADVLCSYEDALVTHRLCHDIVDRSLNGNA